MQAIKTIKHVNIFSIVFALTASELIGPVLAVAVPVTLPLAADALPGVVG